MKYQRQYVLIFLLVFYPSRSFGYEVRTHRQLSEQAVPLSVLQTDPSMLSNIGLEPLSERQQFPNVKGDEKSINELIQDGSEFEDDGFRSRGHFFNPLNGYALFNVSGFVPSPDWTLEDTGDISGQNDSFKDTRQFFFEALTLSSETDRKMKWGRTFQGLGQVIHHLQDMAQPEHSRVDPHLVYTPEGFPSGLLPGEDPSRYEHYSAEKSNICDPPISPPALPTLPTPCFSYLPFGHFEAGFANYCGAGILSAQFTDGEGIWASPRRLRNGSMSSRCSSIG